MYLSKTKINETKQFLFFILKVKFRGIRLCNLKLCKLRKIFANPLEIPREYQLGLKTLEKVL